MTFQLEVGIPVPARKNVGRKGTKYPFAVMEPEQSFLVPSDIKAATVRSAIGAYKKRNPDGGKFAIRVTDEGTRVWRTE